MRLACLSSTRWPYDAGRDGFWLRAGSLLLADRGAFHPSASVAVSRETQRAKTDRLERAMLMRVFLAGSR